jgi:hypothetical protein
MSSPYLKPRSFTLQIALLLLFPASVVTMVRGQGVDCRDGLELACEGMAPPLTSEFIAGGDARIFSVCYECPSFPCPLCDGQILWCCGNQIFLGWTYVSELGACDSTEECCCDPDDPACPDGSDDCVDIDTCIEVTPGLNGCGVHRVRGTWSCPVGEGSCDGDATYKWCVIGDLSISSIEYRYPCADSAAPGQWGPGDMRCECTDIRVEVEVGGLSADTSCHPEVIAMGRPQGPSGEWLDWDFYDDGNILKRVNGPPYEFTWDCFSGVEQVWFIVWGDVDGEEGIIADYGPITLEPIP